MTAVAGALLPGPALAEPAQAAFPRFTSARLPLTREVEVLDEFGERRRIHIPVERPLTVYVDKRELVTLMTLGEAPELLVLGHLRNQRLIANACEIVSITADWDVHSVAVKTRLGIDDLAQKTATRVVTTGCGQGSVFGDMLAQIGALSLPDARSARISQSALQALLEAMRQRDSIHRKAGSVHGCALFLGAQMLVAFEDVGRHNAIDSIAGWMWMTGDAPQGVSGSDKILYTTGRLTSEMVMKAALMGVPIIVSRNGVTQMGLDMASRLGMTLFGRAANRHFICYTGFERFDAQPDLRPAPPARLAV
jgi:FdhD protein